MEIHGPTIDREMECQVCQDLSKMFLASRESLPVTNHIDLGYLDEALATNCQQHKLLVESFVDYYQPEQEYLQVPGDLDPRDMGIYFRGQQPEMFISPTRSCITMGLALVNKSPVCNDQIRKGRIVDPMYVDLDILKYWLNQCVTTHGNKCHNPMKIWHTRPAWLVDVKEMCVVPGDDIAVGSSSFVALSYRWGSQPSVSVAPESMLSLQRPGILDDPANSWVTPLMTPMVRHAMYLTSVLGERYLWVDTLCIVHGDCSTAEQLSLMGAFYANAAMVIVAADGDAQEGIAGLRGIPESRPREAQQLLIPFGDDETILMWQTDHFLKLLKTGGPYFDRGWTYQEYKMASRKVFFKDGLMHWECQCSQWHENLFHEEGLSKYIERALRDILAGFPVLDSLSYIIGEYNCLDLRYEEDALPGISGLLSVFSRSFTGGFLYGIPEAFFDRALGWEPLCYNGSLTRRKSSDRPSHLKFTAGLPSWSWIGWKGPVHIGREAFRINYDQVPISDTIPITRWFTGSSPKIAPQARRKIRSNWYEQRSDWKKSAADHALPLPTGWTHHEVSELGSTSNFRDDSFLWPEDSGEFVYKHKSLPDDDPDKLKIENGSTNGFFYPFPVPDITERTPPDMPEQTAYLFCTTQRARLWTRGDKFTLNEYQDASTALTIQIHDESRDAVGSLHLHDRDQLKRLLDASVGTELGVQVELVAINRVRTYGNTLIKEESRRSLPLWTREEYTVLWIEWEGGVAYRNGVGSIEKSKWEHLDLEDVDLVLG